MEIKSQNFDERTSRGAVQYIQTALSSKCPSVSGEKNEQLPVIKQEEYCEVSEAFIMQ